jgi:hypothetical protein
MESMKYEKITFSILSRSSNSKRSERLSSNMLETLGVGTAKLSILVVNRNFKVRLVGPHRRS